MKFVRLIAMVAYIGRERLSPLAWLTVSDGRWLIVIISSAILLSGPMFMGYAVFDELGLYLLLLPVILSRLSDLSRFCPPKDSRRLQSAHKVVFLAFAFYAFVESIRGIFVLDDIRVLRFTAMFGALAVIAFLATSIPRQVLSQTRIARIIVWSGVVYLLTYIAFGVAAEWLFQTWRFDLQGHIWSGTTAALFSVCVLLPPMLIIAAQDNRSDRRLFWLAYVVMLTAGFYYQSRSVWLAGMAILIVGALTLGVRRLLIAVAIYAGFVVFFPWTVALPLTPTRIASSISGKVDGLFQGQPAIDARRFRAAVFGGFVGVPADLGEANSALTSIDSLQAQLTKLRESRQKMAVQAPSHAGLGNTKDEAAAREIELEIVRLETELARAHELSLKFQKALETRHIDDIDRKLALIAAGYYVVSNGPVTFLFGTGYYTHRYKLLGTFGEVADLYGYTFPPTYRTVVRTATFNGMLVDNGIIGILLFGALFVLTGLSLIQTFNLSDLRTSAPQLMSLVSLGLVALSLVVGATFDVVLLYLAVMPYGAILVLYPTDDKVVS